MADLRTRFAGIELRNPFLLASGIWGESGDSLRGAYEAGAGGVVSKSIGPEPRPGYSNPTITTYEHWGFLNAMGLPNPGIDEYPGEIARARAAGVPVLGSVFAPDAETFAAISARMAATGVLGIELNLSCPHAKGLGSEIGSDPSMVEAVTRAVVDRVDIPVLAKLTPNTHDIGALAEAAERGGAAVISAINTVRGMAIEVGLRRPTLSNGLGGLSGPAIKPVGLAAVWQIARRVKVPVVGIGGITTADDAIEYLMAGASAVQVGTAVAFEGIGVFGRLVRDLDARMEALGVHRIDELIGVAQTRKP